MRVEILLLGYSDKFVRILMMRDRAGKRNDRDLLNSLPGECGIKVSFCVRGTRGPLLWDHVFLFRLFVGDGHIGVSRRCAFIHVVQFGMGNRKV